ncbi:MAG: hypothetical protein D9C04_07690 [Nitrosopumilus sp. B06]|nr:MAG: hypothetical protein D9C04_07690 [Nitrosopumilus sp. B06]
MEYELEKFVHIEYPHSALIGRYFDTGTFTDTVMITKTIQNEWNENIGHVLRKRCNEMKISLAHIPKLELESRSRFRCLYEPEILSDSHDRFDDVKAMYQSIWNDPDKSQKISQWRGRKFENWKHKNKKMIKRSPSIKFTRKCYPRGPPAGNDLIILSTAASLAKTGPVRLLTFDNDFIIFADEIREFGIEVINGYELSP